VVNVRAVLTQSAHRLPAIAIALACAGCGDGGGGDLDKVPPRDPSAVGDGMRLSELNDPANPRPPENAEVYVSGISVVAVDTHDETANGSGAGNVYAQDLAMGAAPKPYSGITLFGSSFTPPSLRVGPGDVIDARGAYTEFPGPPSFLFPEGETLPELVGASVTLRFEYLVPEPITISLDDLASYDTGRQWIGMLVRVENVASSAGIYCGSAPGACQQPGRQSIRLDVAGVNDPTKLPTITNALFDLANSGAPVAAGTKYASIVGVVQYFFNFSIAARSAEDIVGAP
jgi:hypothetical protein